MTSSSVRNAALGAAVLATGASAFVAPSQVAAGNLRATSQPGDSASTQTTGGSVAVGEAATLSVPAAPLVALGATAGIALAGLGGKTRKRRVGVSRASGTAVLPVRGAGLESLEVVPTPTSASAYGFRTTGTVAEKDGVLRVSAQEELNYDYHFVSIFQDDTLANEYKQYGRALVITDDTVNGLYGQQLQAYFESHGVELTIASFPVNENTKTMRTLESMIDAMRDFNLKRQEPVLLMGGGLITDVGGFACSQMRRNTPYIRIPTSLIGLIDASIAIKVAVNHGDGKNKLGAYHAHKAVFLDTAFLATLPAKELRVGMAEIIKISVVESAKTFELLEVYCEDLMQTKFGYVNPEGRYSEEDMAKIKAAGQEIVFQSIHRMLELESPNLKEYNLDRAIAFGHTWSPELELIAKHTYGKLIMHGQAVAMDMALSMTLAAKRGIVPETERDRVHGVISRVGLMLDHPVQWESDNMAAATREIEKTRNGLLRAAVPIEKLGQCAYLNDVSHEELMEAVEQHKAISAQYPRNGLGVDFWIEKDADKPKRFVVTPVDRVQVALDDATVGRTYAEVADGVEAASRLLSSIDAMAASYSSQPSEDLKRITAGTADTNELWAGMHEGGETQMLMEAEMISGQAEAQMLKVLIQFGRAKDVLDIGTFTGYSALAMAEALPADGSVTTIEREARVAKMAQGFWEQSAHGDKITSIVGAGGDKLACLASEGKQYDMVFLDADKPNYLNYYKQLMDGGLLKVGGMLVVDNSMYKGEELAGGELSQNGAGVKSVNEAIVADDRVEKVMLPLRDGVTLVYRKA